MSIRSTPSVSDKSCQTCSSFFNKEREERDFYLISLHGECERCLYRASIAEARIKLATHKTEKSFHRPKKVKE